MNGKPNYPGETGQSWGHPLVAVEGLFGNVVWECGVCGEVRTRKQFYENVDCT
jgi:hypothetical protein